MVGKIIREYLEGGNKKITVPGFGTFMRKESGEIIFVDLLRKDDGVLRGLVEDYGGYSEVEAMALADRFVFGIKRRIEHDGSAPIEGFGTMTLDDKGTYQFNHSPQTAAAAEVPVRKTPRQTRPQDAPAARPQTATRMKQPERRPVQAEPGRTAPIINKDKRSRPDIVIIVAIVAAIIAVLIIVYGMSGQFPFLK